MKTGWILVASCIVATTSKAIPGQMLLDIVHKTTDPATLAARLVQTSTALYSPPACNRTSGYKHCETCAMPVIQDLLAELVSINLKIWTQNTASMQSAGKTCTKSGPGERIGGLAKCCTFTNGNGAYSYASAGFSQCNSTTFDPAAKNADGAQLHQGPNPKQSSPYKWFGPKHSSMVTDCCDQYSTCRTNEEAYTTAVDNRLLKINSLVLEEQAIADKNVALALQVKKLKGNVNHLVGEEDSICKTAPGVTMTQNCKADGKTPGGSTHCFTLCASGSIQVLLKRSADHAKNVLKHADNVQRAMNSILQVQKWLDHGVKSGKEEYFVSTQHPTKPKEITKASMISLLESSKASSDSALAREALEKATKLLQSTTSIRAATSLNKVFKTLIATMQSSKDKMLKYAQTIKDNAAKQAAGFMVRMTGAKGLSVKRKQEEAAAQQQQAQNSVRSSQVPHELEAHKKVWFESWKLREQNIKKCMTYMVYFDEETRISTDEILKLKVAIDWVKKINCNSNPPTAYPTPYPTGKPTAFPTTLPTGSPTTYPTAAPTATPTGYPTVSVCAAGLYKFMSKVYTGDLASREKYNVPLYTKGVAYRIAALPRGQCTTLKTRHLNSEGLVQEISHEYKCCPRGGLYGSVSSVNLCNSNTGQYCELFGANMYNTNTADPSKPLAAAPTASPVAAPTGFPTKSPTAYPTSTPTGTPTPYPTSFPTSAPTESPTNYPTDYQHIADGKSYNNVARAQVANAAMP